MSDEMPEEQAPTVETTKDDVTPKDAPAVPSRLPWIAMGVGSAALAAALLYATRSKRHDWGKSSQTQKSTIPKPKK